MEHEMSSNELEIKKIVKEAYGKAAARAKAGARSCCGPAKSCCSTDPITKNLYSLNETSSLPEAAMLASLGCVLLSAKRVGPKGKAYGLDMTDEMLSLARENQRKAGIQNVEFLKGEIENIPLPDNTVDVIISNCVINLSGDKDRVLREAFRVLKSGGRFAVSDIVVLQDIPAEIRRNVELWTGCVAGALHQDEYRSKLHNAGFDQVHIEPTRIYGGEAIRILLAGMSSNADSIIPHVDGKFASAFIRAYKT
jgi:SAM-dependent methyltransferase